MFLLQSPKANVHGTSALTGGIGTDQSCLYATMNTFVAESGGFEEGVASRENTGMINRAEYLNVHGRLTSFSSDQFRNF